MASVMTDDLRGRVHAWRLRRTDEPDRMTYITDTDTLVCDLLAALEDAERERDEGKARYERLMRDPAITAEAMALDLIEALEGGDHD